jgi:hypothetical protein
LSYFEKKRGDFGGIFSSVNSTTNFWEKKGHKFDIIKLKKKEKKPLEKNRKFPFLGENGPKSSQK